MVKKSKPYNAASADRRPYLFIGESLGTRIDQIDDEQSYYIWPVKNQDLGKSGRVLLDIYTRTKPSVLIGGNSVQVDVLEGLGTLTIIQLADGSQEERVLEPGVRTNIPSNNVAYWYENTGAGNLLLRDTCPGFDPTHEPLAEDLVRALTRSYLS